jgi:hypothetical protein
LESAEPDKAAEALQRLDALVDEVIAGTTLTRRELLSALRDRYREYKRAQLLAEQRRRSV